jgi:hypothetical protein
VLLFAEELGQIGAERVDQDGELSSRGIVQDMLDIVGEGIEVLLAQSFRQAGSDEFSLAIVKVNPTVLIDEITDLSELLLGEFKIL